MADEACAQCGRIGLRLTLTSRGPLCATCLVAAKQELAVAPPWRTLWLTELTGAQLITAVAWGVVQGLAIWALIGAAIAVVIVAIRLVLAAG